MTKDAAQILDDALQLPAAERAQVAADLLASLEDSEEDVEAAWAAEIERRAVDARQNPADEDDWRAALAEIQREVLTR